MHIHKGGEIFDMDRQRRAKIDSTTRFGSERRQFELALCTARAVDFMGTTRAIRDVEAIKSKLMTLPLTQTLWIWRQTATC